MTRQKTKLPVAVADLPPMPDYEKAANPNYAAGKRSLSRAAFCGGEAEVGRFIAAGADVNRCDNGGDSPPLELALFFGGCYSRHSKVKLLLDAGAIPSDKAAVHSCVYNEPEVFKAWLAAGGDINAGLGDGDWTPLMHAACAGCYEMVEFLLSIGVDSRIKDWRGRTAFKIAKGIKRKANKAAAEILARHAAGVAEVVS